MWRDDGGKIDNDDPEMMPLYVGKGIPDGRVVCQQRQQRWEVKAWVFQKESAAFPDQRHVLSIHNLMITCDGC